jgi:hypothetical protein
MAGPRSRYRKAKRALKSGLRHDADVARDVGRVISATAWSLRTGKRPYVLAGANFERASAGTRACHRLVHELNQRGLRAYSLGITNPDWDETRLTREGSVLMCAVAGAVAVYPEVLTGNPLKARRVARWVLNTPGYLAGDAAYDASELVFTWSKRFYDTDRVLTIAVIEPELFNADGLPAKTLDCFYVGKGHRRGAARVPLTDGMTEITSVWPPTRPEVADLLRRTRTLYTYDDCTSLMGEALQCGCRVVLLPEEQELTLADVERDLPDLDHGAQLTRFVDETQHWK